MIRKIIKDFNVDLVKFDRESWQTSDTSKLNRQVKWVKNIQKDNYIFEASNIVSDMK